MLITFYLYNLHNLQAKKMVFLKLFLICTFKDLKKKTWQKTGQKLGSAEPVEPAFCNSGRV